MSKPGDRVREVFEEVSAVADAGKRGMRLAELCGGDSALRRRVEALLEAGEAAEAFFAAAETPGRRLQEQLRPKTARLEPGSMPEQVGSQIGHYRLVEMLGEGGFGQVWKAEQLEPVRRVVALKILKAGMDTKEVLARFDAERQALALMDHPHVAHVYEAGSTPTGRPFFVMELVVGSSITEYCDRGKLGIRERVRLLLPVCMAVQHAHQKGIIHRDLKPTNLLVREQDGVPHPMVIDFGIAKALQEQGRAGEAVTRMGQMVGTPAYMSPEQAVSGARDVDTRADVYSLGAVLYELLTGQTPLDGERLGRSDFATIQRMLMEEEPLAPSARVAKGTEAGGEDGAVLRGMTQQRWVAALRGDLDWVVMKALEKDRESRYATANALARDLERYLNDEPVTVGPPSAGYRLRKLARRHRQAVVAGLGVLVALVVGLALATVGFLEARREGEVARAAEERAVEEALQSRRLAYASDMNLARHALENSNLGLARRLLERHRPEAGKLDLRHWEWGYLWQVCRSEAAFTLGQEGVAVTSLACPAGGETLVVGGEDGGLSVWDLVRRERVGRLEGAGGLVAVSSENGLLASGSPQPGLALWRLETMQQLAWLPEAGRLSGLAFSPRGDLLAGVGAGGEFVVRHGATWQPLAYAAVPAGSGFHVGDLLFAGNGAWVLHGGADGRVRTLFARTGEVISEMPAHEESITAMALSPDGGRLVTASGFAGHSVRVWRLEDRSLEKELEGHRAWVAAVAYSPDGRTLATAGADQTVRMWDAATLQLRATLRGHLQEVWSLVFVGDGKQLVTGGKDGELLVWDTKAEGGENGGWLIAMDQVAFGDAGSVVWGLDKEGRVMGMREGAAESLWAGEGAGCMRLSVAAEAGWVATADTNGVVRVGPVRAGPGAAESRVLSTNQELSHLQFSADGRYLLEAGGARQVRIHHVGGDWSSWAWDTGEHALGPVAFSPDGRLVASGGSTLVLFRRETGEVVMEWRAHQQPTDAVAFSPDGKWLVTASQEGLAKLWDTDTWREAAVLRGHLLGVHAVAMSPDSRRLATGSIGGEAAKVWDLATGQEVLNVAWPGVLVNRLAFSADGSALLAAGDRVGARVWRVSGR